MRYDNRDITGFKTPLLAMVIAMAGTAGCKPRDQALSEALNQGTVATAVRPDFKALSANRQAIVEHLSTSDASRGWEWFMYRPHGFAGLPMVVIKLLPELDPEIWGTSAERFARFGHFSLPGDEDRSLPSTIGMAAYPTSDDPSSQLLLTTETCGTCHMGRVRIPGTGDDDLVYIYGGVNTQFDIRKWRTAIARTIEKHLKSEVRFAATSEFIGKALADKPAGFFHADPVQDRLQRKLAAAPGRAEELLRDFITKTEEFRTGTHRQSLVSYKASKGRQSPRFDEGSPGQVDASGDLLAQRLPDMEGMPAFASLTDIPSVWYQRDRSIGQWDGSVADPFQRNLAAQVAVVPGNTVDRRVAAFALDFTNDLPSPQFPFLSETSDKSNLIAMGEKLFTENCADCHRPRNETVYTQMGTDMNRARIMTPAGGVLIRQIFLQACTSVLPDGSAAPACTFGASERETPEGVDPRGYAAQTLAGIWARAPYLHNGSVPTLRHLLQPGTRPKQFVVGSLGYDPVNVGFQWDARRLREYQELDAAATIFNTEIDGLQNTGHDQRNLRIDGKSYRLDWTLEAGDDPQAAQALLEYLKTL